MIFKKQIKGCCEYWVKWQFRGKNCAIGKYNPCSSGSWFLEIDDMHYLIRKNIFWWSHELQAWLYKRKIYWHNWIIDECTPGFECCMHKVPEEDKQILCDIYRASQEQIPYVLYFGKDKKNGKNK